MPSTSSMTCGGSQQRSVFWHDGPPIDVHAAYADDSVDLAEAIDEAEQPSVSAVDFDDAVVGSQRNCPRFGGEHFRPGGAFFPPPLHADASCRPRRSHDSSCGAAPCATPTSALGSWARRDRTSAEGACSTTSPPAVGRHGERGRRQPTLPPAAAGCSPPPPRADASLVK